MAVPGFEQVAHDGEMLVDGVEQPEVGDVGGGEFGQALIFLAAHAGQDAALGGQNFDETAGDGGYELVGRKIEQRRGKLRIELKAVARALDARHRHGHAAALGFAFHQNAEILACQLDWFFRTARVFVAE